MVDPTAWAEEFSEGFKAWRKWSGALAMTQEEAAEVIRANKEAIGKSESLLRNKAAQNAANRFVKTKNDYAQEIINKTQALLKKENSSLKLTLTDKQLDLLTEALKNTEETATAIKSYAEKMKDNNDKKTSETLKSTIKGEQHNTEEQKLKKLFDQNSEFVKLFGDDSKTSIDTIKNCMTVALSNHQNEQLKAFDDDLQPNLDKRLELQQRAEAKILFLSNIARNTRNWSKMKEIASELTVSNDDKTSNNLGFGDHDLDKLKDFYSSSGKLVNITENGYNIKSGPFGFGITEKDALQIALLGKAKGWKRITLTVEHSDPEKLNELARKAATAAIKAGFDPDSVTIKIKRKNEKGETVEEDKKASEILGTQVVKSLLSASLPTSSTQEYKTITDKLKDQAKKPPEGTNNTQPQPLK